MPRPILQNRSKNDILTYLSELINTGFFLSGQQCGDGSEWIDVFYNDNVQALINATGKTPSILGFDYGYTDDNDLTLVNTYIKNHWDLGGLVTLTWHVRSPFQEEISAAQDSITDKNIIDLSKLLKTAPTSDEKTKYLDEINKIVVALNDLRAYGVQVFFRPFHEMNGNWFWWGTNVYNGNQTNEQDFIALWKDLYDRLVNDSGLDNLIWVYSPSNTKSWYAPVTVYYPGTDYVDIVGTSMYTSEPIFSDVTAMKSYGKPIAMCEVGPNNTAYGIYDESKIINQARFRASYFVQWHSWTGADVSIIDNLNYNELMLSPYIVNIGDYNSVAVTVGTNSYITLADATTYFKDRLYAAEWTNASADDKARALIMATKRIDSLVLRGIKSVNTQTLQFPRAIFSDYLFYFYDEKQINFLNPYGYYVVEAEVSQLVKDACCEEALGILKDYQSAEQRKNLQEQGVKSVSIGNVSETYGSGRNGTTKLLSNDAQMLMKPYLLSCGAVI